MAGKPKVTMCCCCGQVLPPKLKLPVVKQRIYDMVARHPGIRLQQLINHVYAEDPNGGPESLNIIHVHVHQINLIIIKHGLQIRGHTSQGYRLVAV